MRSLNILIAVLLIPSFALAEGMKHLPMWSRQGDLAFYTFEQTKDLVKADAKITLLEGQLQLKTEALDEAQEALASYKAATAEQGKAAQAALDLSADLHKQHLTCIEEKAKAEASGGMRLTETIAWGLVLVLAGVAGGFALKR